MMETEGGGEVGRRGYLVGAAAYWACVEERGRKAEGKKGRSRARRGKTERERQK